MKTVTIEVDDMLSALSALGVEKQLMRLPDDARRILRPSRSVVAAGTTVAVAARAAAQVLRPRLLALAFLATAVGIALLPWAVTSPVSIVGAGLVAGASGVLIPSG